MRHKYETRGLVLQRTALGEANALVTVLTPGLGLLRVRAQGVRRPGAKLAASLATFAESSLVLVRGQDVWRITGAVLEESWFRRMPRTVRERAARITGLLLRLVGNEVHEDKLFSVMTGFFAALTNLPPEEHESAEVLAALHVLSALGLDAGTLPGNSDLYSPTALSEISLDRRQYVTRINRGITASGL
jgi:DNA repair protein RecO (recombination protein O)